MKSFLEVLETRKSARSFLPKPIDHETLEKILTLATYAPTNCNLQLWNFIVIEDAETKEQLINEAASNTMLRRVPTILIVTFDGWNYKEAMQGASLAVGHILLAAHYYGLSAMAMNSYGADRKIKKILEIPDSEVICCFVTIGYPDERAESQPVVSRRPVNETIHWGRFKLRRRPPFTYNPNDWTLDDLKNHQKYYCRKTFLGKEMDIISDSERKIIREKLKEVSGPIFDFLSYDGSYLREFPREVKIISIDLTTETSRYTAAALELNHLNTSQFTHQVYNEVRPLLAEPRPKTATFIFKLERISDVLKCEFLARAHAALDDGGKLVIISRKSNLFLFFFFFIIKGLFGKDLRKTGIYSFFGPYKPLRLSFITRELKKLGFKNIQWSGYFFLPPFYEQAYQMLVQYIRSEGSSYLHRDRRDDVISRMLAGLMRAQGLRRVGWLGSVAVITCHR